LILLVKISFFSQNADIGLGPFPVTHSRYKVVDFSVGFHEEATTILIPPPAEESRLLACTKPFRSPSNVIVLSHRKCHSTFSEKKKNRGVRAYEWPEVELAELVCFLFRQGSHVGGTGASWLTFYTPGSALHNFYQNGEFF
jgi:hypothetical protein